MRCHCCACFLILLLYAQSGIVNSEEAGIVRGRPFGGVAVFIQKSWCRIVSLGTIDDNSRVIGIKIVASNFRMLIFSCYFPYNDNAAD